MELNMEFNKQSYNWAFNMGVEPLFVLTLQEEVWHNSKGEPFKEKKLDKIWSNFNKDYVQGGKFRGNQNYNPILLPTKPVINDDQSELTNQREYAVLDVLSFGELSNLPESILKTFKLGLRLFDRNGNYVSPTSIPDLETVFEDGEFGSVATLYTSLTNELERRQKELQEEIEDLEQKRDDEIILSEEALEKEEDTAEEQNVELVQEVASESIEKEEQGEETLTLEQDEEQGVTAEELVQENLKTYIERSVVCVPLEEDFTLVGSDYKENDPLLPFVDMTRSSLSSRLTDANRKLQQAQQEYRQQIYELLNNPLSEKLEALLRKTDPENQDSQYYLALENVKVDARQQRESIQKSVDAQANQLKNQYEYDLKEHLEKVKEIETQKYHEENRPKLKEKISQYESSLIQRLAEAEEIAREDILKQADDQFQDEVEILVDRLVSSKESDLEAIMSNYHATIKEIENNYQATKEKEINKLRNKASQITSQQYDYSRRGNEEVEARVQARLLNINPEMQALTEKVKLAESARENAESQAKQAQSIADTADSRYKELSQRHEELKKENANKEAQIVSLYQEQENQRNQKERSALGKYLLIASTILTVGIAATTLTVFNLGNKKTVEQVKKLQSENKELQSKANQKYRVGEYIPVDTGNGQVSYGKIQSLNKKGDGGVVVVKEGDQERTFSFGSE
jgi:hypothetical protein